MLPILLNCERESLHLWTLEVAQLWKEASKDVKH